MVKSKRILSLILVFIMIFTMLPLNAFANSLGNVTGSEYTYTGNSQYKGDPDLTNDLKSMNGYKVSVWFSEVKQDNGDGTYEFYWGDDTKTNQVGATVYKRRMGLITQSGTTVDLDFWSKGNAYSQITQGRDWLNGSFVARNYEDAFLRISLTDYHVTNPNNNIWFIKSLAYVFDFCGRAGYNFYDVCKVRDVSDNPYGLKALQDWCRRVFDMGNPNSVDLAKVYDIFAKAYVKHGGASSLEEVQNKNFAHMYADGTWTISHAFRRALIDLVSEYYKVPHPGYDATWQEIEKTWSSLSDRVLLTGVEFQLPFPESMKEYIRKDSLGHDRATPEYVKSYFLNPIVLEDLAWNTRSEGASAGAWHVWDFIMGVYTDESGNKLQGQYKIFVEPVMFRIYRNSSGGGSRGVVSWHDLMAMRKEGVNSALISGVSVAVGQFANALTLEREEDSLKTEKGIGPLVGSNGLTSAIDPEQDLNKNGSRGFFNKMDDQTNTLGVAVFTSPSTSLGDLETPEIIKTYVMITGVDAEGNVEYSKAADTTKSAIDFFVDSNNNITSFPVFEQIENQNVRFTAVLNDVFTTPYDLAVTKDTEWVDTDLIDNVGVDLELSAKDIAGYNFGLVTESEVFIDAYKQYKILDNDVAAGAKALVSYLEAVTEQQASAASQQYNLFGLGDKTLITSLTNSVYYTHHMSEASRVGKLTLAELNEFDSSPVNAIVSAGIIDKESGKVVKMTEDYMTDLEDQYGTDIGLSTPANTVVLRYIVKPSPKQVNLVRFYEKDEDGTLTETRIAVEDPVDLNITGDTVVIQKPVAQIPDKAEGPAELVKWVTNSEYPVITPTDSLPIKSENGLEGTTDIPITNYPQEPITHNLYVEWKVIVPKDPPPEAITTKTDVPEWRLSRYIGSVTGQYANPASSVLSASMSFTKQPDVGCKPYDKENSLTPKGTYKYKIVNPNGRLDLGSNTPENMNMLTIGSVGSVNIDTHYQSVAPNSWFHSRGFLYGGDSDSISHGDNYAELTVDANLNMIKSYENGSLTAANWITNNTTDLDKYSIHNSNLPEGYSGESVYHQNADLRVGIYNADKYTHIYGSKYRHTLLGCRCKTATEYIYPYSENVTYKTANYGLNVTFDRYIQKDTTAFVFNPTNNTEKFTEKNGLTTIRYQLDESIKIYPEVGMLFDNDANVESIRWIIGDKAREIKPVVYQTLEHKVYVKPFSTGSSVATDTRGITKANSIGEAGKQIIYKGAAVNSNFRIYQAENSNKVGLLTVKTYALDFNDNGLMASVKNSWGNNTYNSYDEHKSLLANIQSGDNSKATATEKLLVDIPYGGNVEFTGAVKSQQTSPYKIVKYTNGTNIEVVSGSNGAAVVFEHELIVRGGYLIGVRMDKHNGSKELLAIADLKAKAEADEFSDYASFYNALINMNLYDKDNKKANTVFKSFEHKPSDSKILDEEDYAMKLASARSQKDGISTPPYAAINNEDRWYSEDTTVLVIKEYISNFEVPSISISDKLPMTISGTDKLNTSVNKNLFFSELGKGYLYLKYNLDILPPTVSGIGDNSLINAYFEYTSFPDDIIDTKGYSPTGDNSKLDNSKKCGEQGTNYLVPNVSITDTTRMN